MAAAGGGCRLGGRPYDKSSVDSQFADDDDDGESAVLRPETSKSRDQIALETPKFWYCIWRRSQSRTRQLSFCARSTSQKFRLGSAGEATVSVFDRSPGHSFGLGISREIGAGLELGFEGLVSCSVTVDRRPSDCMGNVTTTAS